MKGGGNDEKINLCTAFLWTAVYYGRLWKYCGRGWAGKRFEAGTMKETMESWLENVRVK
jgi:hypothetical protein